MNNQRRKELNKIATEISTASIDSLEFIKSDIEMVLMDEEWAFESMPENLQYSMRGEASQEAQDNMNKAIDLIDEFINDMEYRYIDVEEYPEDLNPEVEDAFHDMVNNVIELLDNAAV